MNENEDAHAPEQTATVPSYHEERLSIPQNIRITSGVFLAVLAGLSLGSSHGGKMAGMRFRAENSHRFPKSQAGWFLYHKSKNYHVMLGGLKEGFKMGVKVGIWAGGFLGIESFVDEKRGSKDFLSSAVAGLSTATAFSVWSESRCARWCLVQIAEIAIARQVSSHDRPANCKDRPLRWDRIRLCSRCSGTAQRTSSEIR